ncbi:hypothetical protein [Streptomyces echinatus]|uniref:hypothetical protein n=1 Tax=Streptomyces echinatus TaxID=67293 RepID=UPI0037FFA860
MQGHQPEAGRDPQCEDLLQDNGLQRLADAEGRQLGVAATDVLDGTKFYLQFAGTSRATGLIDY